MTSKFSVYRWVRHISFKNSISQYIKTFHCNQKRDLFTKYLSNLYFEEIMPFTCTKLIYINVYDLLNITFCLVLIQIGSTSWYQNVRVTNSFITKQKKEKLEMFAAEVWFWHLQCIPHNIINDHSICVSYIVHDTIITDTLCCTHSDMIFITFHLFSFWSAIATALIVNIQ